MFNDISDNWQRILDIPINGTQTPLSNIAIVNDNENIQDELIAIIDEIPYVRKLIAADRPRAKDLERDKDGKIIIDITNPHILEDMDYFRPAALLFEKTGSFSPYTINANPKSEYGLWVREEIRRCYEGYIRESDGEWITGDYYFYLNYCPILQDKKESENSRYASRIQAFPKVWDGQYYLTHYLHEARLSGKHAATLSARGRGKSYLGAAMLAKRFILGESQAVNKNVQSVVAASTKKYLTGANQIIDMFTNYIDFCASNTEFPAQRLRSDMANLVWKMGYIDLNTGTARGTLNTVTGIIANDDSKLRGSRGVLYLLEEFGTFPNLLGVYNNLRPSVEDGNNVYGLIYMYGTAGDTEADYSSAMELMYNAPGYNIYTVPNVYDREQTAGNTFTYFYPAYLNRANCYDNNGNSDVTKALSEILEDRLIVRNNASNILSITRRVAELPIAPQEAMYQTHGNIFPSADINTRLAYLQAHPEEIDSIATGTIDFDGNGNPKYVLTTDVPIRDFPYKGVSTKSTIEFFDLPKRNSHGEVFPYRYIIGHDPVDDDNADTSSLSSTIVFDLWTDTIVAEYTGRREAADENYEIVRRLCLFYNAICLYENNKKGLFAYFSKMNSLQFLADTPEYLRDKSKYRIGFNTSKGVYATRAINNYANKLIHDWLLSPDQKIEQNEENPETASLLKTITNKINSIKNIALLKELSLFNDHINVDRIRALGMVMLLREERIINKTNTIVNDNIDKDYLGNDPFFNKWENIKYFKQF